MESLYLSGQWIYKLADEVNVGVCLADHQKAIRYVNYYHLAHIWKNPRVQSPSVALGQPLSEVFPYPLSIECERLFDQVLTTGRWSSIQENVESREGPPRMVEVSAAPLGHDDTTKPSVVMLSSDLGANSLTDLASQELQYCAASFSVIFHELRNHMHIISGGVGILERYLHSEDEMVAKAMEHLTSGVTQLQDFLKKSTDLVRPICRRGVFNREIVSLNEFLIQNADDVRKELSYLKQTVTVTLDLDTSIPFISVNTWNLFNMLKQLLQNSIEALSEGGEILVSTKYVREGVAPFVQLEVADDGQGMDEEIRRFALKPFYTTKPNRLGLGLPMCRKIMKDHGGNLTIHTKHGVGTCVRLIFRELQTG